MQAEITEDMTLQLTEEIYLILSADQPFYGFNSNIILTIYKPSSTLVC